MISYIKGEIIVKGMNFLIIVVNGIGYKVFVNDAVIGNVMVGAEVELFIHHHVREDAETLYGFFEHEQLEMFEILLSVSGIGPKSALGVLSVGEVAFIRESIASGDHSVLTKVSGIGKKTAERVVIELRDKIVGLNLTISKSTASAASSSADEIDALMALGYSMSQAREALKKVDPSIKGSAERIREALKGIKS